MSEQSSFGNEPAYGSTYGQPTPNQAFQPAPGQSWSQQYSPQPDRSPPMNGLAIASMVLGIVWIYWLGSILAVIFGHIALHQTRDGRQSGRGFAVAGVALGWTGVGFLLFFIMGAIVSSI